MFALDPQTFYTRDDLAELLRGSGVDVDLFIARIKPRKVFRKLYSGKDLLAGYDQARCLSETEYSQDLPSPRKSIRSGSRTRSLHSKSAPGARLARTFLGPKDLENE